MTTRHLYLDILWWIALVTLAGILTLFAMSRPLSGAEPVAPRGMHDAWTVAVEDFRAGRIEDAARGFEALRSLATDPPFATPDLIDEGLRVWLTLSAHARGEWDAAAAGWRRVDLLPEQEIWRHLGQAAWALDLLEMERADEALDAAARLDPDQPLLHYYLGKWNLQMAVRTLDWPDAREPGVVRLVAARPALRAPNTRSMFELAAVQHFEKAIARGESLDRDALLMPASATVEVLLAPTVGDFLRAVGAERFLGEAHLEAARIFIRRGNLDLAEKHLDDAAAEMLVGNGYADLANAYEEVGRYLDAARARARHLKTLPPPAPSRLILRVEPRRLPES